MAYACGDKGTLLWEMPEGGFLKIREGRKIWD